MPSANNRKKCEFCECEVSKNAYYQHHRNGYCVKRSERKLKVLVPPPKMMEMEGGEMMMAMEEEMEENGQVCDASERSGVLFDSDSSASSGKIYTGI